MNKLTDQELIDELQKRFEENKKTIQELKDLTEELKIVNKKLEESQFLVEMQHCMFRAGFVYFSWL